MATRRRIGVRLATTEAARRQLMQPVACWEKVWVAPEEAANSSMKIYKWIKTDKKQQFSDDEEEADEPLAPLPDEPEVVEGDDDMDQDEPGQSVVLDNTHDAAETNFASQEASERQTKPISPTPPALSLQQTGSMLTADEGADMLDASFKALGAGTVGAHENVDRGLGMGVYEGVHGLGPLEGAAALLGGPLMGDGADPFTSAIQGQRPAG